MDVYPYSVNYMDNLDEVFSGQIEPIIGLSCRHKSKPEGRQIMSETRFTEFLALSVDLMIDYFSDLFSEKSKF